MEPITLWGHWGSPNPWKVIIILKELDLPYEHHMVELPDAKKESYTNINPNGRLPAIEDPNTGVKLWETGAIIFYLIDRYDKENKISYPAASLEYLECMQWLMFQVSGQGPYFGQLAWFTRFQKPEVPSAIERYSNEMIRIFGVLNKALENRKWLVGDKCTFADLSFATWSHVAKGLVKQLGMSEKMKDYPRYTAWLEAMEARQPVCECLDEIISARAARGLPP